jgi:hypothetical protein
MPFGTRLTYRRTRRGVDLVQHRRARAERIIGIEANVELLDVGREAGKPGEDLALRRFQAAGRRSY